MKEEEFFLPDLCELKSVFILCISAELIALVLILATGDRLLESWDELGLLSVFVQWIVLSSAGLLCVCRKWLARLSVVYAAILAYLLVIFTSAVISFVAQFFLLKIGYQWGSIPETITEFVSRCVLISAVLTLVLLRYFYVQQQWRRRIQLESQARIESLQARIRPHFLFNSMNIIASLISSKPKLAEQAVEDLSELFRATLRDSGSLVPFREEWMICTNYLRIEALRLGDRLNVESNLENIPLDAMVPMLSLQPLVENAIYHGIQPLPSGGTIDINATLEANQIHINLRNPMPKRTTGRKTHGNRIAMVNIINRLNLLFGSQASLKVEAKEGFFEVLLILPYVRKTDTLFTGST
jgi:two-component system sensor histidine kinase AlgZ